jgi:hypothetical protein
MRRTNVRIIPKGTIKEDGQVYNAGEEYEVDDDIGRYFVKVGWAKSPDYKPDVPPSGPTEVNIQPHSTSHSVSSPEVEV